MKIQLISKGTRKAEVIVTEDTEYGKVRTTRHLLLKGGEWTDKLGNKYTL